MHTSLVRPPPSCWACRCSRSRPACQPPYAPATRTPGTTDPHSDGCGAATCHWFIGQCGHGCGQSMLPYCAVDIARHLGPLDGLVTADAALQRGMNPSAMVDIISKMQAYPGIATALWVAHHADARCESPLETLGRHAFITAGLPAPLSNAWVRPRPVVSSRPLLPETGVDSRGRRRSQIQRPARRGGDCSQTRRNASGSCARWGSESSATAGAMRSAGRGPSSNESARSRHSEKERLRQRAGLSNHRGTADQPSVQSRPPAERTARINSPRMFLVGHQLTS